MINSAPCTLQNLGLFPKMAEDKDIEQSANVPTFYCIYVILFI